MRILIAAAALALLTACSGAPNPDLAAWNEANAQLRTRVQALNDQAVTAAQPSECPQDTGAYQQDARNLVGRMGPMAGDMDECRQAMGGMVDGGARGMCDRMGAELDDFQHVACTGQSVDENATLIRQHCQRMLDLIDGAQQESDSLGGMMGGGGMMRGGSCGN